MPSKLEAIQTKIREEKNFFQFFFRRKIRKKYPQKIKCSKKYASKRRKFENIVLKIYFFMGKIG